VKPEESREAYNEPEYSKDADHPTILHYVQSIETMEWHSKSHLPVGESFSKDNHQNPDEN